MSWKFTVYLPPKGAARCRASAVTGAVHMYPDQPTEDWKTTVGYYAVKVLPKEVLEGPVKLDVVALIARPQRLLKRSKRTGELLGAIEGLMWCETKPDEDNIKKGAYDGLKSVWRDDAQICYSTFAKCYVEARGRPRIVIRISRCPVEVPESIARFVAEDDYQEAA